MLEISHRVTLSVEPNRHEDRLLLRHLRASRGDVRWMVDAGIDQAAIVV